MLEKALIHDCFDRALRRTHAKDNIGAFGLWTKELCEICECAREICCGWREMNAACELKEVFEDVLQARGFATDARNLARELFAFFDGECGEVDLFERELHVELNRREWVLDFVRESACHRPKFSESFLSTRAFFCESQSAQSSTHHDRRRAECDDCTERKTDEETIHGVKNDADRLAGR